MNASSNVFSSALTFAVAFLVISVPFFALAFWMARSLYRVNKRAEPDFRFKYSIAELWIALLCLSPALAGIVFSIESVLNYSGTDWEATEGTEMYLGFSIPLILC